MYYFSGTRIVYERAFLMNLRNSPISRTPPKNMPSIPADLLKNTTINTMLNTSLNNSTKGLLSIVPAKFY